MTCLHVSHAAASMRPCVQASLVFLVDVLNATSESIMQEVAKKQTT